MTTNLVSRPLDGHSPELLAPSSNEQSWVEKLDKRVASLECKISTVETITSLAQSMVIELLPRGLAGKSLGDAVLLLTAFTVAPLFAAVVGSVKAVAGATQAVAGLAIGLLAGLASPFSENARALSQHGFRHVVHGAANILAAVIHALPVCGLILSNLRYRAIQLVDEYSHEALHAGKFLAYKRAIDEIRDNPAVKVRFEEHSMIEL